MTRREIIMRLEILTEMMNDLTEKLKQTDVLSFASRYERFNRSVRNLRDVYEDIRRLDDRS